MHCQAGIKNWGLFQNNMTLHVPFASSEFVVGGRGGRRRIKKFK